MESDITGAEWSFNVGVGVGCGDWGAATSCQKATSLIKVTADETGRPLLSKPAAY
jgi:hypothetical protein